jgi:hypothetical protein
MTFPWALLAAVGYLVVSRYSRGSVLVGGLVFSHWVLDSISHRPDLPLYPGSSVDRFCWALELRHGVAGTLRGQRPRTTTPKR